MIRRSGTTIQGGSADSPDFLWYNAGVQALQKLFTSPILIGDT